MNLMKAHCKKNVFFSTSFKVQKPEDTNVGAGSPWAVLLEE